MIREFVLATGVLGLAAGGAMRVVPAPRPVLVGPVIRDVRTFDLGSDTLVARGPLLGSSVEQANGAIEVAPTPGGGVTLDVPELKADDFQATLSGRFLSGDGVIEFGFHLTSRGGDTIVVFSDGRVGGMADGQARSFSSGGPLEPTVTVTRAQVTPEELADSFTLRVKSERHRIGALINQRGFALGTYPYVGSFGLKITGAQVRIDSLRVVAPYP